MLIRISLIIAILAGLAVGTVNFIKVKEKITTLQTDLKNETDAKEKAQRDLAKTSKDLDTTKKSLDKTKQDLATANTEKQKAIDDRDAAVKHADQLTADLSKAKADLADSQSSLEAYRLTGLTPPQILALNKQLKDAQAAVSEGVLVIKGKDKQIVKLQGELDKYTAGAERIVYLRADLIGKIVVVDPKYSFVILNVGEDQGVKPDGELLVSRKGQLVAKVRVTTVEKDRCIANVLVGPSKLGEPIEGDVVIPAHPAS